MRNKGKQEQQLNKPDQRPVVVQTPPAEESPCVCGNFRISPVAGGWAITEYLGFSDKTKLTIPSELDGKRIVEIGASAFENCKGLQRVKIGEGITKIAEKAFSGCTHISACSLPKTLKHIGSQAFGHTHALTFIELPESLESIGSDCFAFSELETVMLPPGIRVISEGTFFMCSHLKKVELPRNLNEIGSAAFRECKQLRQIAIPEGTRTIMPLAFSHCFLDKIAIPSSVIRIGRQGINGAVYGNKTEQEYHWKKFYDATLGDQLNGNPVVYCEAGSLAMSFARWNGLNCLKYEDYWKEQSVNQQSCVK